MAQTYGGRLTLGAGGGGTMSVSEAEEKSVGLMARAYAMMHLNNYVAIELGYQMTRLESKTFDPTKWGDFSTTVQQPDLRLRLYPLRTAIQPYLTMGAGMLMYRVDSVAISADPKAVLEGTLIDAILGAGLMFMIGENFGVDVQGTTNLTFSDNQINPTTDGKDDAYWAVNFGLTYTFGSGNEDRDGDGLLNDNETKIGTDPDNADTDGDGLKDGDEVNSLKTDPLKADTDGDGLNDYSELNTSSTDPLKMDSDADGLNDGDELKIYKTDPTKPDTDADVLPDGIEVERYKTDPTKVDTDGDGLADGAEINQHKTDPLKSDTDGDGLNDREEVETFQTSATNPDTDTDGLNDGDEVKRYKTLPKDADTDHGSILDGAEVKRGTNPLDAFDDVDRRPKLVIGKPIVLEGIEFDNNQSTIKPVSEPVLRGVLQTLNENLEVYVLITGHTDNVGKRSANMKLSQARADAVKAWLVGQGVASKRIATMGIGPDRPIATNTDAEGKQKNRRIEFERVK
jgi:outer membrane protein OmpA-like peptidoglycan-associated protein